MIEAKRPGRVLNVSSTASTLACPGVAHYAASKAGRNQLTRLLAVDWAEHGILVNAVVSGVITNFPLYLADDAPDRQLGNPFRAWKRVDTPEAQSYLFW